jgi:hypothetical protein
VTYSRHDPSLNPPSDNTEINGDLFNLMHGTWYSFRRHWEACFTFSKSKMVRAMASSSACISAQILPQQQEQSFSTVHPIFSSPCHVSRCVFESSERSLAAAAVAVVMMNIDLIRKTEHRAV